MLTHLSIALLGAGIFLRIVAKEKHRRHRHLLLRLAEQQKMLLEAQLASHPPGPAESDSASQAPYEATPVGQAA